MEVLRTPDERFRDLVDFPFSPHYINIDDEDEEWREAAPGL